MDIIANDPSNNISVTTAENLGTAFKGTNVSWKNNPANNTTAIVNYHPNSNNGYEVLLVDNGLLNTNTPINAFRFISVNINDKNYKVVTIKTASGSEIIKSVGRIVRFVYGSNKKLYVATEGSIDGGGHIIEYDPNTQTALDLGKPFYINGSYLDIYSLSVGTDGALYIGSFGGSGNVMTSRYNYNGVFETDNTTLDNVSRYVDYISGDETYTYASCGENNWMLYAINRSTKEKKVILSNSSSRISINTFTDAPYASLINTNYQLKNGTATALGFPYVPTTNELAYSPYSIETVSSLNINYNMYQKTLSYTLIGNANNSITISDIQDDTYPTGESIWFNNQLYLSTILHPLIGIYNDNTKDVTLGNIGIDVYSLAANTNTNKIEIGGYPKGDLFEYNVQQPWTLDGANLGNYSTNSLKNQTNPKLLAMLQDADVAGINGTMYVSKIAVTKNNLIVAAGNNDRITTSSDRVLAISTINGNNYSNLILPEFSQYQFSSMCLAPDSNNVIISAVANSGQGKIYKYNPSSNSITQSFTFPVNNPGQIVAFDNSTIAGVYNEVLYLFDLNTGTIVWTQTLSPGQRIYAITKAPDNSICIAFMYLQATHFNIMKYRFTKSGSAYTATNVSLGEFSDVDNFEPSKPQWLTFGKSYTQANAYDLYVTGLKSIYRFKNCIN